MEKATPVKKETRRLPKPNNIVAVSTTLDTDFFEWWCAFLRPLIKLRNREMGIVASLLKKRWELSKVISDPDILDSMVMRNDVRDEIIKEMNITLQNYYVVINNLRKNNIITKTGINPRLIPNIREDDNGTFQLLVLFKDNKKK